MKKGAKTLYDYLPTRQRIYQTAYHRLAHYVYPDDAVFEIKVDHYQPRGFRDRLAYSLIRGIRKSYDFLSRYNVERMTEAKWVQRCLIL